jgi:hypothetical protein
VRGVSAFNPVGIHSVRRVYDSVCNEVAVSYDRTQDQGCKFRGLGLRVHLTRVKTIGAEVMTDLSVGQPEVGLTLAT